MAEQNPNHGGGRADNRSTRCPHCAGPLTMEMETSKWTVTPLVRDSFSMIGSAVGGIAGAFYGYNRTMPIVRRWIKGPMWLHFFIGGPPIIVFSSGCAGLAGEMAAPVNCSCLLAKHIPDRNLLILLFSYTIAIGICIILICNFIGHVC
ncbi:uncharacterized protein LOC131022859 isoform X1 [Salvia miltiorrhiza]|uniref:uncharacterized protein LOC131022859 isoform X1 n=1 Tax=Salvia miltiorrhiza TaxID=226208 RepID=UPI0025ABC6CE|nr:uncharacterized protein LOC131022859 isoform X1 [Salvia miltiorrhiza]